jgi:hypothetical protein
MRGKAYFGHNSMQMSASFDERSLTLKSIVFGANSGASILWECLAKGFG